MGLKRKPPPGHVRRVAPIDKNLRYTITSKDDETVQCESFQERKLTLLFDRDPTIQAYRSQPEHFTYTDTLGKKHTYIPDFIVWKTTGEVEIHEVTLTSRRQERLSIQEREKGAQAICQARGWRYIVHTEQSLPQATEEANLLALYCYRPTIYANAAVTTAAHERLAHGEKIALLPLIADLAQALNLPTPTIVPAICHLLWHQVIATDLRHRLLFVHAALAPYVYVWSPGKEHEA